MFKLLRQWRAKRQEKKVQKYLNDPELRQAVTALVQQALTGTEGVTINAPEGEPEHRSFW